MRNVFLVWAHKMRYGYLCCFLYVPFSSAFRSCTDNCFAMHLCIGLLLPVLMKFMVTYDMQSLAMPVNTSMKRLLQ